MHRFLHECLSDPALGAVIAVAVIVALAMAWFVLMDRLKKRQKRQRRERRRRDTKGKAAEPTGSTPAPGQSPVPTQDDRDV